MSIVGWYREKIEGNLGSWEDFDETKITELINGMDEKVKVSKMGSTCVSRAGYIVKLETFLNVGNEDVLDVVSKFVDCDADFEYATAKNSKGKLTLYLQKNNHYNTTLVITPNVGVFKTYVMNKLLTPGLLSNFSNYNDSSVLLERYGLSKK